MQSGWQDGYISHKLDITGSLPQAGRLETNALLFGMQSLAGKPASNTVHVMWLLGCAGAEKRI